MSADGMKDLERRFDKLSKTDVKKEVANAIQTVRTAAIGYAPTRRYGSGGGSLKQSIYTDIYEDGDV